MIEKKNPFILKFYMMFFSLILFYIKNFLFKSQLKHILEIFVINRNNKKYSEEVLQLGINVFHLNHTMVLVLECIAINQNFE